MNSFHETRGCFSSHLISVYSGTRTWTTASAKLQCTTPMPKAVSKCQEKIEKTKLQFVIYPGTPRTWDPSNGKFPILWTHLFRDSYGSGMGIVCETYQKGVPCPWGPLKIPLRRSWNNWKYIDIYIYKRYPDSMPCTNEFSRPESHSHLSSVHNIYMYK